MIRPSGCRAAVWLAPVLVVMGLMAVAWPSAALAQLPATRLAQLFPSGSQVGASTEVVIAGNDLDDVKELHFSHPGITAQPKMAEPGPFDKGPVAVPNTFVVSVAGNVPPGLYEARAVGRYGISNPRAFVVTELKHASEVEPNNEPEQATELAWPGEIAGRGDQNGDVDYFKFTAKPNERIIINCLARRIDSRMDPLLVIYDAAGRELQSTREGMRGDPVLDFIVPAAGDYLLKVFDTRYNGGDDYFYRLRVGTFPHLDFVFPPAGQAGGNRAFTVFGRNLPGGQPAGLTIDGRPLQKLNVNVPLPTGAALDELTFNSIIDSETAGLDGREYRLNSPAGWSNPLLVGVASSPVVLEQEPNNAVAAAQAIQTPCEVAGQFYPARDLDWFQFSPKAGETYVVELISQRLGRPTDPSLIVEQVVTPATAEQPEVVRTLASVDDAANSGSPEFRASTFDPAAKFTIPDDFSTGGIVRVLVRDGYSEVTGDPRNAYRLVVRPPQPDFRLVAAAGSPQAASLLLRKGGCVEVRVVAFRQDGFDGEIKVTASGLPGGVTCAPAVIGPGVDSTTLVLVAAENAPAGIGLVSVTGEATLPSGAVKHAARFGTPLWPFAPRPQNNPQPPGPARLARNLAVSVSADEVAPVLIQAGGNQPLEASRGAIVKVPYTVTRRGEFNGNVACIVEGLPAGVNVQPFTINGNQANGEFQLTLTAATPPGTYSIWLAGLAQPMPYERNPDAAKRAAERKAELDAIVVDLTKKSTDATAAKTAADKVATDAMAAVQAATTAKENADKAAAEAKTAADAAADSATKAKAAAAATPGDANLAAAATAAQKAADDAATKAKTAADAVVTATKALDDANAALKKATEDKAVKDKAAEEAAAMLAAGQAAKADADRRATETANAAKKQNLNNVYVPSTVATLKIAPAPITMALAAPTISVKQGAMVELPVNITRLYSYADAVTISAVLPGGVGGLSIPNAAIANNQTQTKLAVSAAANATDGEHKLTIRATLSLNGQQLLVEQPCLLKVEKVEATP